MKMKNAFALLAGVLCSTLGFGQLNMTLLGQLDYQNLHNSDLSDIWGYVDGNGNEYALVGVNDGGLSIVDVTTPSNPQEVFFTPGPGSIWRDIKTWGDYAYMTTEGGGGLVIVDMSGLPGNTNLPVTTYDYTNGPADNSAHNLYIDENGICYIFGADRGEGGVIMLDVATNPMAPVEVGEFDLWYAHDGVARGDTLYVGHILDGFFSIVDVSDKANPVLLGTMTTPSDFAHNVWFSDDGDYLYTTDEVAGAYLTAYDISDPTDIQELDRIQSNPGSEVIPHNTHFFNDYLITSYYRDGVTIHDVSNPTNMIEVGNYDSSPLSGDGFNGCWGVYPWLPSGNIIASDIEGGLIILGATYVRGCYLQGNVTDAVTTFPLGAVQVELLTTSGTDMTGIAGDYSTGTPNAGTYDVAFYRPGYERDTAYGVVLTNGNVTVQDIALTPLPSFTLTGDVTGVSSGGGIGNASIIIENDEFQYEINANGNGDFSIGPFYDGTYDIAVGQWGYVTYCEQNVTITDGSTLNIQLEEGYYDDFTFDFNWSVSGDAVVGVWERGEPVGTYWGGNTQSNPEEDVNTDCYDQAYVTGNNGGNPGTDDVDDLNTVLTSPTFDLSNYLDPYVSYYRWWFNASGGQTPNDSLYAVISNGTQSAVVDLVFGEEENAAWTPVSIRVLDYVSLSTNMTITFHTADWSTSGSGGNLVEAGIDVFRVEEVGQVGIEDELAGTQLVEAYPNPFDELLNVKYAFTTPLNGAAKLQVLDLQGRVVHEQALLNESGTIVINAELSNGLYLVQLTNGNEILAPVKVAKR